MATTCIISSTKTKQKQVEALKQEGEREMATSGTYVTEVPLKGTAEKHYKRWRSENHIFPDAVGHHIQSVTVHDGEWDSHGAIKIWNYTLGKHVLIPSTYIYRHAYS